MSDLLSIVAELKRPQLLIRAARAGLADYNRSRDLKRLIRTPEAPGPERRSSCSWPRKARLRKRGARAIPPIPSPAISKC